MKVLSVIDFNRIRTLNVKSNIKPWLDVDFLRKLLTSSGKEIDEGNFKC